MLRKTVGITGLIGAASVVGILVWLFTVRPPIPAPATPTPVQGAIQLDIQTPGAVGRLAGINIPAEREIPLPGGVYRLTVAAPGYEAYTQTIEIQGGHVTRIQGALVDTVPPAVRVFVSPSVVYTGATVQVTILLQDAGSGLDPFHLTLDGTRLFDKRMEARREYNYVLPLAGVKAGLHQLELRALDALGNAGQASAWFEIQEKPLDISRIVLPGTEKDRKNDRNY